MKNYVHDGATLTLTLTEVARSGQPVINGDTFGVAITDGMIGEDIAVSIVGVYGLPKLAGAAQQGEKVYWQRADPAATPPKEAGVTKTAAGNMAIGVAARSAPAGDSTVEVRLNGSF